MAPFFFAHCVGATALARHKFFQGMWRPIPGAILIALAFVIAGCAGVGDKPRGSIPPVITSSGTASATKGAAFSYQITATNSPTSFGASGLPAGLTVNAASGLISGTPTGVGTSSVMLSATNVGGTGSASLMLTATADPPAAPVISSGGTASATVGTAFSYQITATNSPTSFGASGLPAGLTINTTSGLISGTPTTAGTATVTLSATNSGGTGSAPLTLTVTAVSAPPVITSSLTASATKGSAFSYQITATNSPTSFGATGLPAGLTINTTSGLISGTPTAAGSSNLTLSATNSGGTGNASLVLTVSAPLPGAPAITSSLTASGTVGAAFSYQIAATNSPTGFAATGLPAGLAVNTVSGLISGAPTVAGTSNVTLSATNSGGTGSASLVLTVSAAVPGAPVITSSLTSSATVGVAFSYQITATNSPSSFGATGLPAGLTVNSVSGLISGTPTAAGISSVTLSATNTGGTGSASLALTVAVGPPVITNSGTASATKGTAFSYQITATNSPTSFGASGLPVGLTVNTASGLISGTPTVAGTATVTLSATNSGGTGSAPLALTVNVAPPVITSSGTASGSVGTAFSYQIAATNSPTSFGASGLPAGLAVNTASGLISGTPTGAAISTVTLSATNSGGTGSASLILTVTAPLAIPVITSNGTASATVGTPFSYQISATNSPTSFGATGLPSGLTVNTTSGLISGTPTAAGTSSVTLSATNSGGAGSASLNLTVAAGPPVITSSDSVGGTLGVAFAYQITATNSPTSFGASGLPAGLAVNTTSGLISGTPTAAGTSTVTLSATNGGGTGTSPLTLTVAVASPVITSSGTASGTVGTAFSYQITATNSPSSFGASGLPGGLAVNTASGLISGTPTGAAGTSSVTLKATNSGGTGSAPLTLTINGGGTGSVSSHTIQISNDADDGYSDNQNGTGWHSTSEFGGVDLVGSWGGQTTAYITGYRFPSVGANSGDTIQAAYLKLVSSTSRATNTTCGTAPCSNNYTFRVYGVAQDNGPSFTGAAGNTPQDVPYTTAFTDYTTTGPGDAHGSCQGQNQGENSCTHVIDVTNIVREITSRPGWTNTSAMRFVLLSTDSSAPNVYAGFEDYSGNASKAATLLVNPPVPTIVSSGAWGTGAHATYPTTYTVGPFVYPHASTLLLFLGDYYNFYSVSIPQPTVSDSCGNTWRVLAGPTNWAGFFYFMRGTVYYVQNPKSCPAGAQITIATSVQEPIFLHFLAIAGSNTASPPIVSAITSPSPGASTTSATSNSVTLTESGLLVSFIFGDSDVPTVFTPQAGFIADLNSTPTYLMTGSKNVSSPGAYQSQFAISPSDGWQMIIIGIQAP